MSSDTCPEAAANLPHSVNKAHLAAKAISLFDLQTCFPRFFIIGLTLFGVGICHGQTYHLANPSRSPNGIFEFIICEEHGINGEKLAYRLTSNTGAIVIDLPSSYRMYDPDDTSNLDKAKQAKIYWSDDNIRFVLDEFDFHLKGKSYLGVISPKKHGVLTMPFMPENLGLYGLANWRIHVDEGWLDSGLVSMVLNGIREDGSMIVVHFTCETGDLNHLIFLKRSTR